MLRALFNSDFFKSEDVWNARVKSPAELVAGVLKLTREFAEPRYEIVSRVGQMGFMGQRLINPPTVEGWAQGRGWIDTGNMVERINFASERLGDSGQPGVEAMVDRIVSRGEDGASPEALVDDCLDEMGAVVVAQETRAALIDLASGNGNGSGPDESRERVSGMVRLVASTTEFQRA
jgi:uncharacterized protein (DUF1800 family)